MTDHMTKETLDLTEEMTNQTKQMIDHIIMYCDNYCKHKSQPVVVNPIAK